MTGPLGHIGEIARSAATRRSRLRDDARALGELEAGALAVSNDARLAALPRLGGVGR